ncbi:MAG: DUF3309 domain-containing protein [Terracidiphilus sp.]
MLAILVIVLLILALIAAVPTWPHSKNWGYYPSGGIGLALLVVVVRLFMGTISLNYAPLGPFNPRNHWIQT